MDETEECQGISGKVMWASKQAAVITAILPAGRDVPWVFQVSAKCWGALLSHFVQTVVFLMK